MAKQGDAWTQDQEAQAELVFAVQRGDPQSVERLYSAMRKRYSYYLIQQAGVEYWEDLLHESFLAVLRAIQKNTLQSPYHLFAFARIIVHRKICQQIEQNIEERNTASPSGENDYVDTTQESVHCTMETAAERERKVQIMMLALKQLKPHYREILTRFYLWEQTEEEVRQAMHLTPTQFRLRKSNAKQRLMAYGQQIAKRQDLANNPS